MEENGFIGEDRVGYMPKGFYHPEHPEYGFEQVSGQPFEGRSDWRRLVHQVMRGGHALVLPSFEDMIADRLAQHALASPTDDSRLRQARMILMMAKDIDVHYLERRVAEEDGDVNLLDLDALRRKE
jgi:hypothetical protein